MPIPGRGRRYLKRLERIRPHLSPLIYFITICTIKRQPLLMQEGIAGAVIGTLTEVAGSRGWMVGRFVVMPDHVHFFCSPHTEDADLTDFIRDFKSLSTVNAWKLGLKGKLWQRQFFDHLLRSDESYGAKWEYVRFNPVRRGLCASPEEWKYQGEISPL